MIDFCNLGQVKDSDDDLFLSLVPDVHVTFGEVLGKCSAWTWILMARLKLAISCHFFHHFKMCVLLYHRCNSYVYKRSIRSVLDVTKKALHSSIQFEMLLTGWSSPPGNSGCEAAPPTAARQWFQRWRRQRNRAGERCPAWVECPAAGSPGYAYLQVNLRKKKNHWNTTLARAKQI